MNNVLIGTDSDGWNRTGYVAPIDGHYTVCAATLKGLAQRLHALGVQEQHINLASPDDGYRAMSSKEHEAFRSTWQAALLGEV